MLRLLFAGLLAFSPATTQPPDDTSTDNTLPEDGTSLTEIGEAVEVIRNLPANASPTTSSTTVPPTTTPDTVPQTTVGSNSAPPPRVAPSAASPTTPADPLANLVTTLNDPQRSNLDRYFAPESPAFTYFDGTVLLIGEFPSPDPFAPCTYAVERDQVAATNDPDCPAFTDVLTDDTGLITDLSRNGQPISHTVHPIGVTTDLAPEVTVTLHSARHFDGRTQLVMVVANGGSEQIYARCETFVSEARRQYEAAFSPSDVFPGATVADLNVWEVADEGGQAFCSAGSLGGGDSFAEWTVDIPAASTTTSTIPATSTAEE